jgi:hypothetical protein
MNESFLDIFIEHPVKIRDNILVAVIEQGENNVECEFVIETHSTA